MEISRRAFLKLAGLLGAGSVLPSWARETVLKPRETPLPQPGKETFVQGICGMCPAGCGIRVRKMDGRAVGISGTQDHPINQGSLCPKGAAVLQELYHPDRLRGPLVREGPRGAGRWTAISWEEAVRRIAGRISKANLEKVKRPLALLTPGEPKDVHQEALKGLAGSVGEGNFVTLESSPRTFWDLDRTRLLVSFGFDWLQSHPSPVEAQRAFAKLRRWPGRQRTHVVQIEPRFSVTAAKADEWMPIRPGTEGMLALCLARELIVNGSYGKAYIQGHTDGFEEFKRALESFSLERVSRWTQIPEKEIKLLLLKFIHLKPAAAIMGSDFIFNRMAVSALNMILGSMGSEETVWTVGGLEKREESAERFRKAAPQVMIVDRVNPVFFGSGQWKSVLENVPFIVTVSPHMTETAEISDIVLPCHTPLEQLHLSQHSTIDGKSVLNASPRAVEPLYGTKDPGEIFLLLKRVVEGAAPALGEFQSYHKIRAKELKGESLLEPEGEVRWMEIPKSGKMLERFRFSPLVDALKHRVPELKGDAEFPLFLYLFTPLAFFRGEGAHLPYLQSVAGPQAQETWGTWAEIHPDTARKYGIVDGDRVWVESRRGKIQVKARLVPWTMPDVVSVPVGLGHTAYGRWAKGLGANPLEIAEGDGVDPQFRGGRCRLMKA